MKEKLNLYPANFILVLQYVTSPEMSNATQKALYEKVVRNFPIFTSWIEENQKKIIELTPLLHENDKIFTQIVDDRPEGQELHQLLDRSQELQHQTNAIMEQIIASLLADGIDISQLSW